LTEPLRHFLLTVGWWAAIHSLCREAGPLKPALQ
jgi:hypothetical protein